MKKPLRQRMPWGEMYYAAVLKVIEFDPDGSPRVVELVRDNESIEVEDGMHFWVVYGPKALSQRTPKGTA